MSPLSRKRRLRLARFGLFVALAVGLGAGITTFADSAVGARDAPRAVAEEQAAAEAAALPALDASDIPWPREGAAAVAIGDGETLTPSDEPHAMASVTKLLTAMMVLEAKPLAAGESGPDYHFVEKWNDSYEETSTATSRRCRSRWAARSRSTSCCRACCSARRATTRTSW